MAILTPLTNDDIDRILQPYGMRRLALTPTAGGVENTNYYLHAADARGEHKLVLTLIESASVAGSGFLPRLLDAMHASALPTPQLRRTEAGAAGIEWDGRNVLLCSHLPGVHRHKVTPEDCAAIGRFLARLHCGTQSLTQDAPAHIRQADWLHEQIASLAGVVPPWQAVLLLDAQRRLDSLFARSDYAALPEAIVHGDLFRDNALFNDGGLSGVIDFHHAARHKRLFDIAVAVNDWCAPPGANAADRDDGMDAHTQSLLRAYHAIAPLTALELALLPAFMVYAALAFSLSRLHGLRERPDYGKSALPMLYRLERCLAPPWPQLSP